MNRLFAVAMATVVVASTFAQGTFTIRRPADGARVRETVAVRIPKNSIPQGGYIGIVVNGKFLEAVMPDVQGDDYVYNLDTVARKIPDGQTTIEVVLYMASDTNPVVLNRSSVTVTVDNKSSIVVPANGFNLKYSYIKGVERAYSLKANTSIGMVTQAQAALGSRGREITLDEERIRFLWATDNAYIINGRTEGLQRIQILPYKGKDYAWGTPGGATEKILIFEDQMMPKYHRLTNKGREVFSSVPFYVPLEGTSGASRNPTDWYLNLPFPILPANAQKPGDVFPSFFPQSSVSNEEAMDKEKHMTNLPGRGVFDGVQWYRGMPCAKLTTTLQLGAGDLKNVQAANGFPGAPQSLKVAQTVYFAIDRGVVVRQELNFTQESLVTIGGSTGGAGGSGGGPGRPSLSGSGGGGPSQGSSSTAAGWSMPNTAGLFNSYSQWSAYNFFQSQEGGDDGGPGTRGPQGGPAGGPAGGDFGRGDGQGAAGGTGGVKMIQRVTQSLVIELE